MKKYALLILFFNTLISFSQELRFKILNFTEVERTESGEKYSEPRKVHGNFEFDINHGKITIPTLMETVPIGAREAKIPIPNSMVLSIISQRSFKDSEKNKYSVFIGMFKDGHVYTIKLIDYAKPKEDGVQTQIVIEGDWLYTYNVIKL